MVRQGANWFGFETSATMVGGLWAGSTSLTQDFATVVWRLKLLGFNAVRLPFSFQVGARALLCSSHVALCYEYGLYTGGLSAPPQEVLSAAAPQLCGACLSLPGSQLPEQCAHIAQIHAKVKGPVLRPRTNACRYCYSSVPHTWQTTAARLGPLPSSRMW